MTKTSPIFLLLLALLGQVPQNALSLVPSRPSIHRSSTRLEASSKDIPSWRDIEKVTGYLKQEPPIAVDGRSFSSDPNLSDGIRPTLYRERHGWCPYSERVWLALEAKGVEYDTIYIDNIYGRPR